MPAGDAPLFVPPMLARAITALPTDADRAFACEVKWDGLRAIVAIDRGAARAFARSGRPLALPAADALARALGADRRAVIDGELIALGPDGLPSFGGALTARGERGGGSARLVAFDLLHLDGRSTCALPYHERRALLEALVPAGAGWDVPAAHVGDAAAFVAATRAQGLEGVVLKRLDSAYQPGRRPGTWLKLRHVERGTFAIAGWAPGEDGRRERAGSLLLAADGPEGLVFCGRVGSGLTEELRLALPAALAAHVLEGPAVTGAPGREARGWVWTEPLLRCAVEYLAWSDETGALRNPVLLRILGPGEESPLARRTRGGS